MSADQQCGDAHHGGDEEESGADAFDDATQWVCGDKQSHDFVLILIAISSMSVFSPASVTTGSDRYVSVNSGELAMTSPASSSNS